MSIPGSTSTLSASDHVEEHVTVPPFVAHVWLDRKSRIVQASASLSSNFNPAADALGSTSMPHS